MLSDVVFRSRYGEIRRFIPTDNGNYKADFTPLFVRGGEGFIDFDGGPFLSIGDQFGHGTIKSIMWDNLDNKVIIEVDDGTL